MASTINVDNIAEATSGSGVQIPGHVIQCVRTYVASSSVIETTATSFTASGITASITPKASGNLILIDCTLSMVDCVSDSIWMKMYQLIAGGSYAVMAGSSRLSDGYSILFKVGPGCFWWKLHSNKHITVDIPAILSIIRWRECKACTR